MPKLQPRRNRPIRLGFVALADCAPLVMAGELGLFARHGIKVELHREVGWATIRDKITTANSTRPRLRPASWPR